MSIWRDKTIITIFITVCSGIMPQLFFKNGFLLSYLSRMNLSSAEIMVLLALPSVMMFFVSLPFAYFSDKYGKKRIGLMGIGMTAIGYLLLCVTGFLPERAVYLCATVGILLFSLGLTALVSGWFALLSPLVPETVRGTFFGSLRLTWQVFAILCSLVITFILERNATLATYQLILAFFTTLLVVELFLYNRIPELENNRAQDRAIRQIFQDILAAQGYMPFCAYCFLFMLAIGSWPVTIGLLEKDVLHFTADQIVHMGTLLFIGSMAGFYLGGKMVDRFGTRVVFLSVHFSFCLLLFLVLMRDLLPLAHSHFFGGLTLLMGLAQAASSIAMTSEMMALAPAENKAVTLSFCNSLMVGGAAISGVVSGKIIAFEILSPTWQLMGLTLSCYDTLILAYSMMVFVFTVTLGLIPSVIKSPKAQWVPHSPKTL